MAGYRVARRRRGLGLACRARSGGTRWRVGPERRRPGGRAAGRQGGDRRSGRIEAHADVILGVVAKRPDITLAELRKRLAGHGVSVGIATLWRFFARRKITLKKSPGMQRSRIVPTS